MNNILFLHGKIKYRYVKACGVRCIIPAQFLTSFMNNLRSNLLFLFLLLSTVAVGQGRGEENWMLLEGGEMQFSSFEFDAQKDVLTLTDSHASHTEYTAAQVEEFLYKGELYYSLPLNGVYSFFRVLHQGRDFAVLQKPANMHLLQYVVDHTKGAVQICEDETRQDNWLLCEGAAGPDFGFAAFAGSAVSYRLEEAIFLAVEGEVHLVSCSYDTQGDLFARVPNQHKKNRRMLRRLKQVVQNQQQMQALRQYVTTASADLEDPQQLIVALKTIYN